jgi:cation transport regulator ChaB
MANEVAKEAEAKKLVIDFQLESVLAFNDLMSRTEPKGRSEMRNHSKLFRAFNAACRKYKDDSKTEFNWQAAVVEYVDEGAIDYLITILEKRIDSGIPGQLSTGFASILEATDEYKDAKKRAK